MQCEAIKWNSCVRTYESKKAPCDQYKFTFQAFYFYSHQASDIFESVSSQIFKPSSRKSRTSMQEVWRCFCIVLLGRGQPCWGKIINWISGYRLWAKRIFPRCKKRLQLSAIRAPAKCSYAVNARRKRNTDLLIAWLYSMKYFKRNEPISIVSRCQLTYIGNYLHIIGKAFSLSTYICMCVLFSCHNLSTDYHNGTFASVKVVQVKALKCHKYYL